MGRGRGKGKKLTVSNHDEVGSGEEEKIPLQKRRGRPQKLLKDEIDDEEVEKLEEEDGENGKTDIITNERKSPPAAENGKKRKRNSQVKRSLSQSKKRMALAPDRALMTRQSPMVFGKTGVGVKVSHVELPKQSWNASEIAPVMAIGIFLLSLCHAHDEIRSEA